MLAVIPIGGVDAATPVECDIQAYLIIDGPAGTNVRSRPGDRSPVILRAPGAHDAIATVTGFQGGWFRIERLEQAGTDRDEVLLENRRGWIHHSRLRVDVTAADPNLRRQPEAGSPLVRKIEGEQEGVVLLGCSGQWARVAVGTDSGWLSPAGQCANPLTTCP